MKLATFALPALFAACSRTPGEDFPARANAATATDVAPGAVGAALSSSPTIPPGRCVKPTPADPPPAVPPGPAPHCPPDPEGPQHVPVIAVAFPEAAAGATSVDAELVSSDHDTTRGLMYRTSMGEARGMLFDLHVRDDHKFWMHNTCIPLDLLYIDSDGLLVGIVENAPTLNDAPRGVGCPSALVLEVNAGWSRKHGVKAGQHVTLPKEVRH